MVRSVLKWKHTLGWEGEGGQQLYREATLPPHGCSNSHISFGLLPDVDEQSHHIRQYYATKFFFYYYALSNDKINKDYSLLFPQGK